MSTNPYKEALDVDMLRKIDPRTAHEGGTALNVFGDNLRFLVTGPSSERFSKYTGYRALAMIAGARGGVSYVLIDDYGTPTRIGAGNLIYSGSDDRVVG